jgi:transcription elongation factor Elf1
MSQLTEQRKKELNIHAKYQYAIDDAEPCPVCNEWTVSMCVGGTPLQKACYVCAVTKQIWKKQNND